MKIVLVGASGFLGRFVTRALAQAGHDCVVLTRRAVQRRSGLVVPGVRRVQADVYDVAVLAKHLAGAGATVSMAGILNERGRDGSGFRRVHVELPARLIEACKAREVTRVLHLSALNAGQGESHYLRSKGEGERLMLDSGLDVSVFQPSVIFGPGDSFFNRFAALLKLAPVLPIACPDARMQPVYAADVAAVMADSLGRTDTLGRTLELGGPGVHTLQELVAWTAGALGLKRWVPGLPDPLSRLQGLVMDFVPGKPFSSDNYRSLQCDNVAGRGCFGEFGIEPASIEAVVPGYLGVSPRQQRLTRSRRGARRS